MTRQDRGPTRLGLGLAAAVLLTPPMAQAQQWTWQTGASARAEGNSNPGLVAEPGPALNSSSVSARWAAGRLTENADSSAVLELTTAPSDSRAERKLQGQLALAHRLSAPRHTWSASLRTQQDRTQDRLTSAADVGVGPGNRSFGEVNLAWNYQLTERLGTETDASHSRTQYSAAAIGSNFDLSTVNAGLRWRWRETTVLGTNWSRTEQQSSGRAGPTTIDGWRVSASETLSETSSATLSVGQSSTARPFTQQSLVCPLQVQFCQGGLVSYVVAESTTTVRNRDLQYSASADLRLSETTQLAARLSRALATNAIGVTRDDRLGLSLNRSFSPTTSGSLSFDESRSRADGNLAGANVVTLRALGLTATRSLDERWTVNAQLLQRHYTSNTPQLKAQATVFSISLQYQGGTVSVWR